MTVEPDSAADAFVLMMLCMIFLSMGVVALLIICGLRNAAKRNPYVDELLEDAADSEKQKTPAPPAPEPAKVSEPWERDSDWWKN